MLEPVIGLGIKCDAVVSNPPYIRAGDLASLQTEVSVHEPRIALDGGCDGLDCYRRLFASVGLVLKDDGFVAVEVGLGQSREVASIAREVGFPRIEFALDLAGVERVVVAAK
jgi:release factor glutamine methyltransferase